LLNFVMQDFYAKIFFGGRVDQRYKQLARLKLSLVHGCRTCNKQNVPGALEAGISQAEVDAMENYQDGPFSDADKAVLRYAELVSMDNNTESLDEKLYAQLSTHFSDEEICELGVAMAVITGMAKLSFVLDLVEREDYCTFN
ncbi:MAG: carboxymuconolactone decarboxylase family protein, partial [Pseudomonadota bacterium]